MEDPATTKKIIDGFSDDVARITKEFVERSPELRLEDFFRHWNETHMDCLFANRFDPRELFEALAEMNRFLVSKMLDIENQDLLIKATILYFILCLFEKQPHRLRRRIRLTCDDALKLDRLSEELKESKGHDDAVFAWHTLCHDNAIEFVEERLVYGPSMLNNRNRMAYDTSLSSSIIKEKNKEAFDFLSQKVVPSLDQVTTLCDKYENMRDTLDQIDPSYVAIEIDERRPLQKFLERARAALQHHMSNSNL